MKQTLGYITVFLLIVGLILAILTGPTYEEDMGDFCDQCPDCQKCKYDYLPYQ